MPVETPSILVLRKGRGRGSIAPAMSMSLIYGVQREENSDDPISKKPGIAPGSRMRNFECEASRSETRANWDNAVAGGAFRLLTQSIDRKRNQRLGPRAACADKLYDIEVRVPRMRG